MRATIVVTVAVAFLALAPIAQAQRCVGVERWAVKVARDQDVAQVNPVAQAATISALRAIPAPSNPNARSAERFAPVETNVAAVSGILIVIKREPDEDY